MYFQEYQPGHHKQMERHDWGIGAGSGATKPALANGGDEYDVPQCEENKDGVTQTCTHTVSGTWMPIKPDGSGYLAPGGSGGKPGSKVYLAAMHHHCHAPTCLRLDTYNNDTDELICTALTPSSISISS